MNWRVVAKVPNESCREVEVSLVLSGAQLAPATITERLGVQPSSAHAAGTVFRMRGHVYKRSNGVWTWTVRSTGPCSLEEQIEAVLRLAEADPAAFTSMLKEFDLAADVSILWESAARWAGPVLSPQLLTRLGKLQLALNFVFLCLNEGRIEDYPEEQRYLDVERFPPDDESFGSVTETNDGPAEGDPGPAGEPL